MASEPAPLVEHVAHMPNVSQSFCFNKDDFMKKDFNVDQFVINCRRRVPMETVRDDLNIYLKTLQSAMIELINKDYADFVNLSSNLVGLDNALNSLTTPLSQMKQEIENVKAAVDGTVKHVEENLKKQAAIRKKKNSLQILMNIIRSVEKIEQLLGITSASQRMSSNTKHDLSGQLIERVASEFNKLQFYVTKSRDLPLVHDIKPRIATITSTLQYSLEGSFLEGLENKDVPVLRQCLRTYATIDKVRDAEMLFRQHVVKPHMESIIGEEQLLNQPQGLRGMYAQILAFIPHHCAVLKEALAPSNSGEEPVQGYDFTVNAVWPEIVSNVEARMPSIFAPGNPTIFHEKYSISLDFLDQYERLCGTQASVKRLRAHPSYSAFLTKWSLPVYFQIRFQEIAGSLENVLNNPFSDAQDGSAYQLQITHSLWWSLCRCWDESIYLPPLCHRFWKLCLQLISRYNTWIKEVQEKVEHQVAQNASIPISASSSDLMARSRQTDSPGGRASPGSQSGLSSVARPSPSQSPAPEAQIELINTLQLIKLAVDTDTLANQLPELFDLQIEPHLSRMGIQDMTIFKESIAESQQLLLVMPGKIGDSIIAEVTRQCTGHLKLVNDIPRLYRRTNRDIPSKPSGYLVNLLKPMQEFLEEQQGLLKPEHREQWLKQIVCGTSQQYLSVTSDVLTAVKKMEESLKRLKKSKASSSNLVAMAKLTDDDKIRLQLFLDVKEFEKQVKASGLDVKDIPSLEELMTLVEKAKGDYVPT